MACKGLSQPSHGRGCETQGRNDSGQVAHPSPGLQTLSPQPLRRRASLSAETSSCTAKGWALAGGGQGRVPALSPPSWSPRPSHKQRLSVSVSRLTKGQRKHRVSSFPSLGKGRTRHRSPCASCLVSRGAGHRSSKACYLLRQQDQWHRGGKRLPDPVCTDASRLLATGHTGCCRPTGVDRPNLGTRARRRTSAQVKPLQ